jgi:hypothetical protein
MMEGQIRRALEDTSNFRVLSFSLNGSAAKNPTDQNSATVSFRVFAQAKDVAALMPDKFLRLIMDLIICAYPGGTFHLDFRHRIPKPVKADYVHMMTILMLNFNEINFFFFFGRYL